MDKKIVCHKSYGEMNTTSENMTYLFDKKYIMCQHKKFHPLTARRIKCI